MLYKSTKAFLLMIALVVALEGYAQAGTAVTPPAIDHTSRLYTIVVRDSCNIRTQIFNDIGPYTSQVVNAFNSLMINKKTNLPAALDAAFMADLYRYTDDHQPAEVERLARSEAEKAYDKGLQEIRVADYDTLFGKYAPEEVRRVHRDIILTKIRSNDVEKLQSFSEETRENGMQDLFEKYWQTDDAYKLRLKAKYLDPFRADVLVAYENGREAFIAQYVERRKEELRRSEMVQGAFKPIVEELQRRTKRFKDIFNSSSGCIPASEEYFNQEWTPWLKDNMPAYYEATDGIKVEELTTEITEVNPYYDPEFEKRVAPWRWVDETSSLSYELQEEYRIYSGHEAYKVKAFGNTGALAVYNGDRLVAVTKEFEELSPWALSYAMYEADFNRDKLDTNVQLSEKTKAYLAFRLRHHLPVIDDVAAAQYVMSLAQEHRHDLDSHFIERSGPLEFLHHIRGNTASLLETYFEDNEGNIFRRLTVVHYDKQWKP